MFYNKTPQQAMKETGSSPKGLSSAQAQERLLRDGENTLKTKKPPTYLEMFLSQLNEPMIYILMAAAGVSVFLKEYSDALIIAIVILINAVVGVIQEGKAQKALDALKKMSSPTALVRRDGKPIELPAAKLVKGDIVLLEAGRVIPADLRLTESQNLKVEESALTGESVPVEKNAHFISDKELTIGDRINSLYMGTSVSYGRGEGVVVATGSETELGQIAAMLESEEDSLTPLQKRLADLGKLLGIIAIVICVALFGIAILQKRDIVEMLITAISLAVAAVPEGLPAVVTIVLAIGVQKMVKVNSIVKKLPAVETLGSVSVVCSDKTGTLTQNKMTVVKCYANGILTEAEENITADYNTLLEGMVLCNDASVEGSDRIGDPTELALIDIGIKNNLHRFELEKMLPRIDELSFDSERKLMTTKHQDTDRSISYTKGAPDILLARCSHILMQHQILPITEEHIQAIKRANEAMSANALRVLALGVKYNEDKITEQGMIFVGLMGMIDPARPEAKQSVANFRSAGVKTVMITGDHIDTAFAIAKELGIATSKDQCISGAQLDTMSQEQLNRAAKKACVFARVSPAHKVRIVNAFKSDGAIVSMTGDGVNDAPSLKAADIGVAMGITGTDVAKGAADMVLVDDNFSSIEKAIEEGRGIYANIKKTVVFLLSSNLGEVISMFAAITIGLAAPLKSIHILWVNLITDSLPALALGSDDKPAGIMKEQPRDPKASLFAEGGMFLTIFYGTLIALLTLGAFLYVPINHLLAQGQAITYRGIVDALNSSLLSAAQTYAFSTLAVSQLFHAIGMRDVKTSVFRSNPFKNKTMLLAIIIGFGLQIAVTEVPFLVTMFETVSLSLRQWLEIICISATPLVFHELLLRVNRKISRAAKKAA